MIKALGGIEYHQMPFSFCVLSGIAPSRLLLSGGQRPFRTKQSHERYEILMGLLDEFAGFVCPKIREKKFGRQS